MFETNHTKMTEQFGMQQEDFTYGLVVVIGGLHLVLIITIFICACCKKKCDCLDIENEHYRRSSNNAVRQHIDRLPEYSENEARSHRLDQSLVETRENRPVTSWQTSLLSRVQAHLGINRARDRARDSPPAYGSHEFGEGHSNPGCYEDDDLPPYQDHVRFQLPAYVAMDTGSEDKPPLYEEVVNQKNP